MYSSMDSGFITPALSRTILCCFFVVSTAGEIVILGISNDSDRTSLLTGLPFKKCSLTISLTSFTVTFVYKTESGKTKIIPPFPIRFIEPFSDTFISFCSDAFVISF